MHEPALEFVRGFFEFAEGRQAARTEQRSTA
jgi:hypothetical protein